MAAPGDPETTEIALAALTARIEAGDCRLLSAASGLVRELAPVLARSLVPGTSLEELDRLTTELGCWHGGRLATGTEAIERPVDMRCIEAGRCVVITTDYQFVGKHPV